MGDEISKPDIINVDPSPSRELTAKQAWNPFLDEEFMSISRTDYRYFRSMMAKRFKEMEAAGTLRQSLPDPEFPENVSSLFYSKKPYSFFLGIEWKRPHELSSKPLLKKGGTSVDDIIQGELGDCWFLASLASVTKQKSFLNQILPLGQDEHSPSASLGYYYVRIWKFGEWTSVLINDRLPTRKSKLIFGQCTDKSEFWVPIVEKAFARLYGSYEAIDGGFTVEAMEDLTGGLSIQYELNDDVDPKLFSRMMRAYKNQTFMTCTYRRRVDKRGLIALHAYTITGAFKVSFNGSTIELVKIRNPYGDDEWTGNWSDSSLLWEKVTLEEKNRIGYKNKNEGEFWMSFDDFKVYFGNVKMCSIGGVDMTRRTWTDKWCLTQAKGKWQKGIASYRRDFILYAMNPQYFLQILHPDDFDAERDHPDENGKCNLTIGLMQEDKRYFRSEGIKNFYLAIDVYEIEEKPSMKLGPQFFRDRYKKGFSSGKYINKREVTLIEQLTPGNYILVPSRFYSKNEGKFLIRIFSEKTVNLEQI